MIAWIACVAALIAAAPPGLWLTARKDPANTARADVAGKMRSAPREVWSIGPARRPIQNAWAVGDDYLVLSGSALERVRPDGRRVWLVPDAGAFSILGILDFGAAGQSALASVGGGNLVLFDLKDGNRVWRWAPPPKAEQGGPILWKDGARYRLAVFPQNTLDGTVYEFAAPRAAPKLLWHQTYTGKFYANFGPYGVIADMNNDGRPDILLAAKPSYVAAIDGDTGRILFDLQYPIPTVEHEGRPYGLIQAVDLDGDGFRDAVVASCQVEEYIGIVRNRGGKSFELAWSHFVENDLPYDLRELRPQVTSCRDVDGDGLPEFVVGLFNTTGDGKWHTVVFDALKGWDARKLDLPGRYFWGCYDLDGDGRAEIVTSTEAERRTAAATTLQAVDGKSGRDLATLERSALVTPNRPLPIDIAFYAQRATALEVATEDGARGLLVRTAGTERLWRLDAGKSVFAPFTASAVSRLVYFGGNAPRLDRPNRQIGKPAPAVSTASGPLVAFADGHPELIVARGDGTIEGGRPVPGKPGILKDAWSVRGVCPAVWIGPGGERIVAAFDLTADRFHLYRPRAGQRDAPPIRSVDLPFLPYRVPGMLLPFGDRTVQIYVAMKTGVHTLASALYDGDGHLLWRDDADGPYPRPAAVVPFPDGPRLVVDNHGKILFYAADGAKKVVAHGWNDTIPGRGNGGKYVLPIVGPYGPDGAPRIVLSSGLENLEVLDLAGARLAMTAYGSIYERQFSGSAVARRRDGGWMLGVLTTRGAFHCQGLEDGKDRWSIDTGVLPTQPTRVASADIDGDGAEDFVVGLADGTLLAMTDQSGTCRELWRVKMDAAIREIVIADPDSDGVAEIVVETDDGKVRVYGDLRKG